MDVSRGSSLLKIKLCRVPDPRVHGALSDVADQWLIHNSEGVSGKCKYVASEDGGIHCVLYETILSAQSEGGHLPRTS